MAAAIYGQVVATATTASLALKDELGAGRLLAGVVATMLIFWIAHAYANILAEGVRGSRSLTRRNVLNHLRAEWPIVQAAVPTAIALGLVFVGLWERDTGVTVALVLGVVFLSGWGLVLARRSRLSWLVSLVVTIFSGSLGAVIIALKSVV